MDSLLSTTSDWFYELTGFTERPYGLTQKDLQNVYENLIYNPYEGVITSRVTGRKLKYGKFETRNWHDMRREIGMYKTSSKWCKYDDCKVSTVVADVTDLHKDPTNAGVVFQVASQFNALEMVGPKIKPSDGITRYEGDHTQGPACAIACGAGTLYRNYYLQTDDTQLNMADVMLEKYPALQKHQGPHWWYENGYLLMDEYMAGGLLWHQRGHKQPCDNIKVGVQHNTPVTLPGCNHNVTQVYCSALPLSYYEQKTHIEGAYDEISILSGYVLEAAYKATLGVAVENNQRYDIPEVYLTLLGDGAFGNKFHNIMQAIVNAIELIQEKNGLDIKIVCYTKNIQDRVDAFLKDALLPKYLNL